ncbi:MAG: DNA-processing protein DprA [Patescibacteria group bacterium]
MIESLTIDHENYPPLLRHIFDPPPLLYVWGNANILKTECFAVVGTRAHTEYGKRSVQDLTRALCRAGFTIVSGLALGIDSMAHTIALEEKKPTIAVFGGGLNKDRWYPPQNKKLAQRILDEGGLLISEQSQDVRAQIFTFPKRNRIISGMSKGVLVVEGDIKSGTMVTAKCALDQGRDVFSVPGSIYASKSAGTNYLIQKGAKLVAKPEDILEEYGIYLQTAKIQGSNANEEAILKALGDDALTPDEIIRESGLDTSVATSTLMVMEMEKKVRNLGNGKFVVYS